jgi:hypothetical protein
LHDSQALSAFIGGLKAKADMQETKLESGKVKTAELDEPEDLTGALHDANTKLSWHTSRNNVVVTRVAIVIADQPCHGTAFHTYPRTEDNHPDGDPRGTKTTQLPAVSRASHANLTKALVCSISRFVLPSGHDPRHIVQSMRRKNINLHFFRIGSQTDKMLRLLQDAYCHQQWSLPTYPPIAKPNTTRHFHQFSRESVWRTGLGSFEFVGRVFNVFFYCFIWS